MNGQSPASRGNLETRLGSRLKDLSDRIRVLESRRRVSVGSWRFEEGDAGSLVAVHTPTGTRVTLAVPVLETSEVP